MTGLRFRETMTGRIALRALDPVDGYERVDGFAAISRIMIDIADVAAFVAAADHESQMRAEVVIPVLGGRFVTTDGRFVCFRPGMGPHGKPVQQMIYTARLVNDDRTYDMSARKVLEPKGLRIWRVWRDTTTLLVTLHDVTPDADKDGFRPRHLAGVISLTLPAFVRQLTTMHPYGEGGWWKRRRAVIAYMAFFVKGLFRIYLGKEFRRSEQKALE
jgi:hypothetical protein